jgi:hypothetical protein
MGKYGKYLVLLLAIAMLMVGIGGFLNSRSIGSHNKILRSHIKTLTDHGAELVEHEEMIKAITKRIDSGDYCNDTDG